MSRQLLDLLTSLVVFAAGLSSCAVLLLVMISQERGPFGPATDVRRPPAVVRPARLIGVGLAVMFLGTVLYRFGLLGG